MRRIAHISDLHFGRHHLSIAEDLLRSVNDNKVHLVVISGDITQRARRDEFEKARIFLQQMDAPLLLVPGNHDVPLYNLFGRILTPWANYDRFIKPISQPNGRFDDQEISALGLNTARPSSWKNGRLSHEQIYAIKQFSASVPKTNFKILVTHHPLGLPNGRDTVEIAARSNIALKAIAAGGVRLLLSGHHHRAASGAGMEIGEDGSILFVYAGTAVSSRVRGEEGNTYNIIEIAEDCVSVRLLQRTLSEGFRRIGAQGYLLQNNKWIRSAEAS